MNRHLGWSISLFGLIAGCTRASPEPPARTPAGSERPAPAPRDATARLDLPPAPTDCAADAYRDKDPAFCLALPPGYAKRQVSDDGIGFADAAGDSITLHWGRTNDAYDTVVADTEKAGEVRWRGELPGDRGIAWLFAVPGSRVLAGRAVVHGPYHVFTCTTSGSPALPDALAQLAACRSLIVLGESAATVYANMLTGETVELPDHPAWRTCRADRDCIVLHSPCGDDTAPINRRSQAAASQAWTAACGKGAGPTKPPSPGRCRHARCGSLQPSLSEQIEDEQAGGL